MRVTIYGTGAFGLAITSILEKDNEVTLWTKLDEEKKKLEQTRKLDKYLNNYKIGDNVKVTTDIEESIKDKELLIIALPSIYIVDLLNSMSSYIKDNNILILSKGLTSDELLVTDTINKYLDTNNYAVMYGGTFANDILKEEPLGFTIATKSDIVKNIVNILFNKPNIKLQYTDDIIGIQLLGILKNIYAIISGMLDGLEVTNSTKSLFINESLYDFGYIISNLGGNKPSCLTYAGVSDMILTLTSSQSRNYNLGLMIGRNEDYVNYVKENTVEGYNSLKILLKLLRNKNINIEKLEVLNNIIENKEEPIKILESLI